MPWIWLILIAAGLYWYFKKQGPKGEKEIPGPIGLPIVGNMLQLGKHMHLKFNTWADQYGDVYQIKLGTAHMIVMSNPKMVKDILSSDPNWTGRLHMDSFDLFEGERLGIVNSEGEMWEVHRRFLLRQLRDFGFGKSAMENLIFEELNEVLGKFKESEGQPVYNMKRILQLAVINALWAVVTCSRFKHNDPKLTRFIENADKIMSEIFEKGGGALLFIPWFKDIFPEWSGYNRLRELTGESRAWFVETIEDHKRTFNEDNLRDFIDVYLAEVKKTTDPDSVFYGDRAERQLATIMSDLFFAGNDTTSTTLAWGVFYLCKNESVQRKFQEEIKSVTNNSRPVAVADRPNMPYAVALIDETLRMSSIVPTGVQHRAIAGKEYQGYFIPKDALITPNLYHMHYNKKVWGDPENFRPERFLSEDGKKYIKNDNMMPFQIGRRQCAGETMARDTIFLYLTNIFQRFNIKFDPNSPEPSSEPQLNFLLSPQPYYVVMKDRLTT